MTSLNAPIDLPKSSPFAGSPNDRISRRAAVATFISASLTGWTLVIGIGTLL